MEVAPFFVDFHHFLSIFNIFYRFSRFTHFCRDLHFVAIYALFPQIRFGQNSLLRNITRFLHVWMHSHRFPLILITLCMNKRPTSEVEDLPQLVFALAVQNNSTLPQTKLLLADSLRRFKANLVQHIAINFDFVHWKNDTVLNCNFS